MALSKKQAKVLAFLKRPEAAGMLYKDVAEKFGVSCAMVSRVATEKMGIHRYTHSGKTDLMTRAENTLQDETMLFMSFDEISRRTGIGLGTLHRAAAAIGLKDHPAAKRYLRPKPTEHEWDVLRLWLAQHSISEIARMRKVSRQAVAEMLTAAARKLGLQRMRLHMVVPLTD